ncbi:hypothetical protein L873DRAFT_1202063 [Choiromyces venosus 120613-1]|uniref:RING-type domain-containing protein n=1 Tax=Choiromyces venosus 120613-1 TaxID=1336337 RepID=A0A3N4JHW1_9PEZI|nr:hypothetical protein L873DRAFT_1202063 [Choiromyces venosus 120613-1]
MTSYEDEHNVEPLSTHPPPSRIDFSEFFSAPPSVTDTTTSQNLFATFATAFQSNLPAPAPAANDEDDPRSATLELIVSQLLASAALEAQAEALPNDFLDSLDRVPKSKLKAEDMCPICGERFLDDEFPLVVRLECEGRHAFDLECIAAWLKIRTTCPMDREGLIKEKKVVVVDDDEEEEDFDENYG